MAAKDVTITINAKDNTRTVFDALERRVGNMQTVMRPLSAGAMSKVTSSMGRTHYQNILDANISPMSAVGGMPKDMAQAPAVIDKVTSSVGRLARTSASAEKTVGMSFANMGKAMKLFGAVAVVAIADRIIGKMADIAEGINKVKDAWNDPTQDPAKVWVDEVFKKLPLMENMFRGVEAVIKAIDADGYEAMNRKYDMWTKQAALQREMAEKERASAQHTLDTAIKTREAIESIRDARKNANQEQRDFDRKAIEQAQQDAEDMAKVEAEIWVKSNNEKMEQEKQQQFAREAIAQQVYVEGIQGIGQKLAASIKEKQNAGTGQTMSAAGVVQVQGNSVGLAQLTEMLGATQAEEARRKMQSELEKQTDELQKINQTLQANNLQPIVIN